MDPLEALDLEKLGALLHTLNDSEIAFFRLGDLEIGFSRRDEEDEDRRTGFSPPDRDSPAAKSFNAKVVEPETTVDKYERAYRGDLPRFKPVQVAPKAE